MLPLPLESSLSVKPCYRADGVLIWVFSGIDRQKPSTLQSTWLRSVVMGLFPMRKAEISIDGRGKPVIIVDDGVECGISLSHSHGLLALMVCDRGSAGVDIEYIKERKQRDRIARRYFGISEKQQSVLGFYRSWTAREAFVKAVGSGIDRRFKRIALSHESHRSVIGFDADPSHRIDFFSPAPGFIGAVCQPAAA